MRALALAPLLLLAATFTTACPPAPPPSEGEGEGSEGEGSEGEGGEGEGGEGEGVPDFKTVLDDQNDLEELRGPDGFTKFLGQVAGVPVTAPILSPCEFQNMTRFPAHILFLNAQPGGEGLTVNDYEHDVIQRANRLWWGGDVVFLSQAEHPLTHNTGVFVWTIYTEDSQNNRLTLDDVRAGVCGQARLRAQHQRAEHHRAKRPR